MVDSKTLKNPSLALLTAEVKTHCIKLRHPLLQYFYWLSCCLQKFLFWKHSSRFQAWSRLLNLMKVVSFYST